MAHIRRIENNNKLDRLLNSHFTSAARTGYVEVGEDNFCLPIYYEQFEGAISKFEVYEDDVFVCGHPKTGTTWCEEMVWLIVNNLNYEGALREVIYKRFPQLEFGFLFDPNYFIKDEGDGFYSNHLKFTIESKSPRCIKTHLHWSLLPEQIRSGKKQPKMIVLLRNPEDTCVSLFYHSQAIESYTASFEEFCELFLAGRVCFGPFWKQVLSYWEQRHRPNILFVKFKEMKEDLSGVIRKVASFLGKTLTDEDIKKLCQHLSFESMKNNSSTNYETVPGDIKKAGLPTSNNSFVRSGKVGAFKSKMSSDMIERFRVWTAQNVSGMGLSVE